MINKRLYICLTRFKKDLPARHQLKQSPHKNSKNKKKYSKSRLAHLLITRQTQAQEKRAAHA